MRTVTGKGRVSGRAERRGSTAARTCLGSECCWAARGAEGGYRRAREAAWGGSAAARASTSARGLVKGMDETGAGCMRTWEAPRTTGSGESTEAGSSATVSGATGITAKWAWKKRQRGQGTTARAAAAEAYSTS
jgi:hypothetical protein